MKKIAAILMSILFALTLAVPAQANVDTSNAPTRVINLVYDDSGSMIVNSAKQKVDTWCQAKYAVEVFAAMLSEKDTLNVYYMSDFDVDESAGPKLSLSGTSGGSVNVAKVHDLITSAGNTPFNTVRKAYKDLVQAEADEKWLVVLTDGEFQNVEDIDAFFAQKASDVKVMFLGMGPDADGITAKESQDIYYTKAQTNSEILTRITDICTRVFNSHRLDVNVSSKKISFDIPMGELIVFAQGANVEIKGIKTADGTLIKNASAPVTVQYSEDPSSTGYEDFIVDTSLLGKIATFKDDFVAGEYTLDVSGAETIEVYYKPNVEVAAYLKDMQGNEIPNNTEVEAGDYIIEFGLVKAGTNEKVPESKLLGEVTYEANVTNDGVLHENTYASGDQITLTEGGLQMDATARYLEYHKVSTSIDYSIYKNKELTFTVLENPEYTITSDGFTPEEPIVIKALLDGRELTEEEWAAMGTPTTELMSKVKFKLDDFKIEKMSEPGIYHIYPVLPNGKPSTGTYDDIDLGLNLAEQHGSESWTGTQNVSMKMNDTRSWIERNWDLFVKLIAVGILFFLLLGYVPGIKKYLPKQLKKKPLIAAEPKVLGNTAKEHKGKFQKNYVTTFLPYIAEKGTIKVVPSGTTGVPIMQVKGAAGNGMLLINTKAYAGKENITFGEKVIEKETKKPITLRASTQIKVETSECTYTCMPNTSGEKTREKKSRKKRRK